MERGVRPGKVAILGFSAGGHLAGSLSTLHARYPFEAEDSLSAHSNRPDASLPCFLSSFLCLRALSVLMCMDQL